MELIDATGPQCRRIVVTLVRYPSAMDSSISAAAPPLRKPTNKQPGKLQDSNDELSSAKACRLDEPLIPTTSWAEH